MDDDTARAADPGFTADHAAGHDAPAQPDPALGARSLDIPRLDPEHAEVVRVDVRYPDVPDRKLGIFRTLRKSKYVWDKPVGSGRDDIPLWSGEPKKIQVSQRGLGACGMFDGLREATDLAARVKSGKVDLGSPVWTPRDAVHQEADGTIAVRYPEVKLFRDGLVLPTGRIVEIRMRPEEPVLRAGGKKYLTFRGYQGKDTAGWPGYALEYIARIDEHWDPERIAMHAELRSAIADLRGFARINKGSTRFEQAENLAMLTGQPAHTIAAPTAREAAEMWAGKLDEGKPVLVGSRTGVDPDLLKKYNLIGGHAHALKAVVYGTLDEATAERARLELNLVIKPSSASKADPPEDVKGFSALKAKIKSISAQVRGFKLGPRLDKLENKTGDLVDNAQRYTQSAKTNFGDLAFKARFHDLTLKDLDPRKFMPEPKKDPTPEGDPTWKEDPRAPEGYVLLDNPWGHSFPKPIPIRDLGLLLKLDAATLGIPDYLKNAHIAAGHADLPAAADGNLVYSKSQDALFRGRPDPSQVVPGVHANSAMDTIMRVLARDHPETIGSALSQNPDGSVSMRLHEADLGGAGSWLKIKPTGRVFEIQMPRELPAEPGSPGRGFVDVSRTGASWVGFLTEGAAHADRTWSPWRSGINVYFSPDAPGDRGYARLAQLLDGKEGPQLRAEVLTQITGEPARVITARTAERAAATWKGLLADHKIALVQAKHDLAEAGTANPYDVQAGEVYEVTALRRGRITLSNGTGRDLVIPVSKLGDYLYTSVTTLDVQSPAQHAGS